jgi:hypothetical protein
MAGGLQVSRGSNGQAGITSTTAAIPNTSTTVTLVAPSNVITINNYSGTTIIYINPNGAATTSNFSIAPNSSFTYDGSPLSSFQIIGSAASGNYGVWAQ